MKRTHLQAAALADIENAILWYEAQEAGLGVEFILELDSAIDRIEAAPDHYETIYQGIRRALLRKFPYSVYFINDPDVIVIIAVLHQHQNPEHWQSLV